MTQILKNTGFEYVYPLTFSDSDQGLIANVSLLGWILVLCILVFSWLNPGMYSLVERSNKTSYFSVSSKIFWKYGFLSTLIVPVAVFLLTPSKYAFNWVNISALVIYLVHYYHRCVLYSAYVPETARPKSLFSFLATFIGQGIHTFFHAHHIFNVLEPEVELSLRPFCGIWLFWVAEWIGLNYDIMICLVRDKERKVKLPRDGIFELVSCANYLGDFLAWWGFAIVTGASLQIAFASFCSVFLLFKAIHTHSEYKMLFGSKYPQNRKAIFPFLL